MTQLNCFLSFKRFEHEFFDGQSQRKLHFHAKLFKKWIEVIGVPVPVQEGPVLILEKTQEESKETDNAITYENLELIEGKPPHFVSILVKVPSNTFEELLHLDLSKQSLMITMFFKDWDHFKKGGFEGDYLTWDISQYKAVVIKGWSLSIADKNEQA